MATGRPMSANTHWSVTNVTTAGIPITTAMTSVKMISTANTIGTNHAIARR